MRLLEAKGIRVSFGAVKALDRVDFDVDAGEVVALVGDNGAGKSTLVSVLSGLRVPDEGRFFLGGRQVESHGVRGAALLGIATVYQNLALCDHLDVVQNLFLGQEKVDAFGNLDEARMEAEAERLLATLNVTTVQSVRLKVARMSGGQRQSIAVARALVGAPRVVLLDEPTAALGVAQTDEVLALIERLRDQGIGVVLISHNMANVRQVADRIHVLRHGRTSAVYRADEVSDQQIVAAITGAQAAGPLGNQGGVE